MSIKELVQLLKSAVLIGAVGAGLLFGTIHGLAIGFGAGLVSFAAGLVLLALVGPNEDK